MHTVLGPVQHAEQEVEVVPGATLLCCTFNSRSLLRINVHKRLFVLLKTV